MRKINVILFTALAFIGSSFSNRDIWIIDEESQLTIQGSTNVNDFICKIEYYTGTDTLQYVENNRRGELRFTRSRMSVPIRSFDCGAKPISKDFWRTLKSDTHPELEINFISLQTPTFRNSENVAGQVNITLAGVTANYNICYQVKVKKNGDVLLKGAHTVNFSDFGLDAPQKLKGLIKVKELLNVNFSLLLKKI